MSRMHRVISAVSAALFAFGCYSADNDDEAGTESTGGTEAGGSTNGTGASNNDGGSGGVTSGSGQGGTAGSSSFGGTGGAADQGGTGGSSGATGAAGSTAGSSGNAGGSNDCAIDSYTFAHSQTTSSCGFPLPDLYDQSVVTVYFTVSGSQQPLCRHADSQGCALSGGYWWAGNEIALCDETCELLDVEGGSFVAVRGCESEFCSY